MRKLVFTGLLVLLATAALVAVAEEAKVPENITIVQLPPYSPELDPMENLWHYLRSHYWSNRIFGDYGDLCDAAEMAWRHTCLNPHTIQSVCNAPYARAQ